MIQSVMDFIASLDFGLKDGLEILVMSFIFYRLLLLIKGTRAVQMAYGLIGLAVLVWLTDTFEFYTINRLMEPLLVYVPVAIVVVFQNTIRRTLTGFGANPFSRYIGSQDSDLRLSLVVSAAYALAARKIGGLIVLEREQGLRNWTESGISLDASISYDLIVNIFSPYTPLHDGALIIGDGRLKAASCFLPLTSNEALSTQFGTRHRAAIGITEETDALALIISEEQGKVSLAVDGVIYQDMEKADLKRRLERAFEPSARRRNNRTDPAGPESDDDLKSETGAETAATGTQAAPSSALPGGSGGHGG